MEKRLGTYRVGRDLLAAAAVRATERGETVTDVIIRALEAYIRPAGTAEIAPAPPAAGPLVYTPPVPESSDEPGDDPPCRHPAEFVEAGECRSCGADVW